MVLELDSVFLAFMKLCKILAQQMGKRFPAINLEKKKLPASAAFLISYILIFSFNYIHTSVSFIDTYIYTLITFFNNTRKRWELLEGKSELRNWKTSTAIYQEKSRCFCRVSQRPSTSFSRRHACGTDH